MVRRTGTWSASDLLNNLQRGRVAEYLVATALGVAAGIRVEWDAYDVKSLDGVTVEVKASAHVQSWWQRVRSKPIFGIGPSRLYDVHTNTYSVEVKRQAIVYVFALLEEEDPDKVNPLDLDQWRFYVVPTAKLNQQTAPGQKTISVGRIQEVASRACRFGELADAVADAGRAGSR